VLQACSFRPGITLVKLWRGRPHTVIALPYGFRYQGKIYRSLTAIARAMAVGTGMEPPSSDCAMPKLSKFAARLPEEACSSDMLVLVSLARSEPSGPLVPTGCHRP
jgi:hypothetical protein